LLVGSTIREAYAAFSALNLLIFSSFILLPNNPLVTSPKNETTPVGSAAPIVFTMFPPFEVLPPDIKLPVAYNNGFAACAIPIISPIDIPLFYVESLGYPSQPLTCVDILLGVEVFI